MTWSDFIRRFVSHTALALGIWVMVVLALERFIPGFAAPFLNVPALALASVCFLVLAAWVKPREPSVASRVMSVSLLIIAACMAIWFLWWRTPGGMMGAGLVAIALLLTGLFIYTLMLEDRS